MLTGEMPRETAMITLDIFINVAQSVTGISTNHSKKYRHANRETKDKIKDQAYIEMIDKMEEGKRPCDKNKFMMAVTKGVQYFQNE